MEPSKMVEPDTGRYHDRTVALGCAPEAPATQPKDLLALWTDGGNEGIEGLETLLYQCHPKQQ